MNSIEFAINIELDSEKYYIEQAEINMKQMLLSLVPMYRLKYSRN